MPPLEQVVINRYIICVMGNSPVYELRACQLSLSLLPLHGQPPSWQLYVCGTQLDIPCTRQKVKTFAMGRIENNQPAVIFVKYNLLYLVLQGSFFRLNSSMGGGQSIEISV